MKKLIIAICVLLLAGSTAWAGRAGNQFNSNPIVIRSAGSGATVQLNSPRFITSVYWYCGNPDRQVQASSFILEDGRFNEILKDSNVYAHRPSVYNLWIPVMGIHCSSITVGTELFIYTGRP